LPVVERETLDDEGQRIYDMVRGVSEGPLGGPRGLSMISPKVAEAMHLLNEYLRRDSILEDRHIEMSALIAAREFDQRYEWQSHEAGANRAGVEPEVIDAIRNNGDLSGLRETDRTLIEFGRELFRNDHQVSSDLYARVVGLFGEQGMFELTAVMGDYAMAAVMLNAVDIQLPDGREANLPPQ
jgi:4-carboxymuconolactone decarboxylase